MTRAAGRRRYASAVRSPLILLVPTLWVLAAAGPASAQTARVTQLVFDDAGLPELVANPVPHGDKGDVSWAKCAPGGACSPAGVGPGLEPGDVPAGTSFVATVSYQGTTTSDTSPPWLGRVTATGSPLLDGPARAGATVTPRAAAWSGGWGSEYDDLRVEACRTPAAARCQTVSAPGEDYPDNDRPAVVGPAYAGWYLFALDTRYAANTMFAGVGYNDVAAVPPRRVRRTTVRSAPNGPVAATPGLSARILPRARRVGRRIVVARARCPGRCRVEVAVVNQPSGAAAASGSGRGADVRVPAAGVRPGRLRVLVRIDGGLAATGYSRLAPR